MRNLKSEETKGTFVTENINHTKDRTVNEKIETIKNTINELMKLGVNKEDIMKKIL